MSFAFDAYLLHMVDDATKGDDVTNTGRRLSELRRSGAAGPHHSHQAQTCSRCHEDVGSATNGVCENCQDELEES